MPQEYGLIGNPVTHSLSPLIYRSAFFASKIEATYDAIAVRPDELESFIRGRAQTMSGFNVTVPHKERAVSFLDEMSDDVREIGAVNTVTIRNNRLIGRNTDWLGFSKVVQSLDLRGTAVVVIGAGGGARAVVYALARNHGVANVVIYNRSASSAHELVKHFRLFFPVVQFEVRPLPTADLPQAALVVQTTPVGMDSSDCPVHPTFFKNITMAFDLIYTPTLFLQYADDHGCKTHDGLEMLIAQASEAFTIFTGKSFPLETVRKALMSGK